MANQIASQADDLMVGAGEFYFQRDDDTNGFHHLGNVDEFNITNDITTVEKNSSMNRRRELMASVTTAVSSTASLTMTEYNPYNLALGLYGTEGVKKQDKLVLKNVSYEIPSVPGIIRIVDAEGNPYYNVQDIVVNPIQAFPSSFSYGTMNADGTKGTVTDGSGLKIEVSGVYTGTADATYYVRVKNMATSTSDTASLVIVVDTMPTFNSGAAKELTAIGGASIETLSTVIDGLSFKVDVSGGVGDVSGTFSTIKCKAAVGSGVPGKDYLIEEQASRAGIIKITENSRFKVGDTVVVSATVPEGEFVTVRGANAGEISGKILFIGDPNNGDQYIIEGHKVKIKPDGDMSGLIGTDFGSFNLTVTFLADYANHPESPFYTATKVGESAGNKDASGVYDPNE